MLPRIQILQALKLALDAAVPVVDGVPKWKVRHERNRDTAAEEMPCLAIRYIADDAPDVARGTDDGAGLSLAEEAFELKIEFVVDTPIAPESDRETAGDADEGEDPTGLALASEIIEASFDALFAEGEEPNQLGGLVWETRYDGSGDNDEIATPDNVRLAERLTFVYRVRAEAPHKLLTGE